MPTLSRSYATLPSREAAEESQPASVRAQRAVIRSLADALEQLTASGDDADGLRQQLDEEMDRLVALVPA